MTRSNDNWKTLGNRLKEERDYRGYSQKEIAEYLGISRPTVSLIENGERKVDSLELQKLAELYNTSVDNLLGDHQNKKANEEVELLARAAEDLSSEDRKEVLQFAEFLRSRESEETANE